MPKCRYCNSEAVRWQKNPKTGTVYLVDTEPRPHFCRKHPNRKKGKVKEKHQPLVTLSPADQPGGATAEEQARLLKLLEEAESPR